MQPALDLIVRRLGRLMRAAKGGREAYLTALVLLQQSVAEVGLEELDGFVCVAALCSLGLKLADQPRDLNELVRQHLRLVREELGKKATAREEAHFARVLARVKAEEVMVLIRNQFSLSF
jgi:hypothetical protein